MKTFENIKRSRFSKRCLKIIRINKSRQYDSLTAFRKFKSARSLGDFLLRFIGRPQIPSLSCYDDGSLLISDYAYRFYSLV